MTFNTWTKVEHWLRCYQDPQLLYESLRREYGLGPSVQVRACGSNQNMKANKDIAKNIEIPSVFCFQFVL